MEGRKKKENFFFLLNRVWFQLYRKKGAILQSLFSFFFKLNRDQELMTQSSYMMAEKSLKTNGVTKFIEFYSTNRNPIFEIQLKIQQLFRQESPTILEW